MWSACGFEVAIANDTSHFCTLFNQVQAELLEYNQDLLVYGEHLPAGSVHAHVDPY